MTAVQWLYRIWDCEEEIRILERSRQKELDRATKITPSYSAEGGGGAGDVHAKFDAYTELSDVIDHRIEEIREQKKEIIEVIALVGDSRCRRLLTLRFVNCCTWREVQAEMHYSQTQIKNIWRRSRELITPIIVEVDESVTYK